MCIDRQDNASGLPRSSTARRIAAAQASTDSRDR
jgi:hypothetical protein